MPDETGPDPLTAPERRAILRTHLEREKGRVRAMLALHRIEGGGEYCQEDGFRWPCATYRAATDEPPPPTPGAIVADGRAVLGRKVRTSG